MENLSLLRANKRHSKTGVMPKPRTREETTAIYNRNIDMVYRVCFSLMGNRHDAQDATQAVFIKLMNHNMRFSDLSHEKAWLIAVARNQCRDMRRQWWRRKVVALDERGEAAGIDVYADDTVTDALMRLKPELRMVLYLHYYEGYKLDEIANMLRENVNTVKTRIRAAKRRLKKELGDDFDD